MVINSSNLLTVVAAMVFLAVCSAVAQTNQGDTTLPTEREGQVLLPDRPTSTDVANATTVDLRPTRPERPNLPPEVQALLERYKLEARAYLNEQEKLKKQLQGANDKERAVIRAQIRELQQKWSQQAKALRREFKDREPQLRDKLSGHRELLDNTRASTLPAAGDHPRRGVD